MSKKEERQKWILECLHFVSGNLIMEAPERVENFIDARSRCYELDKIINPKRRKADAIAYYINLPRPEKAKLIESNRDLIIALPSDCDTLGISRPQPVAYRFANFGGKTVEYPVFEIGDVIIAWHDMRQQM